MKILKNASSAQAGAGLVMQVVHRHQRLPASPKKAKIVDRLAVTTKGGMAIIPLDEIAYIKAESNYAAIHTLDGKRHLLSKPLKQVGLQLEANQFARCHQSYLVNCQHVRFLATNTRPEAVLSNNAKVPVSRRQLNQFKNRLLTYTSI